MRVWLMRHGEAEPSARTDAERKLTERGRAEVLHSSAHLQGRPPLRILASPYVRAQQTAQLVLEELGGAIPLDTVDWLTPDIDPQHALRQLSAIDASECLLVAHQPLLGALAGLLVHGHLQQPMAMGTASLVALDGDVLAAGVMDVSEMQR
jgi:phosphohistidine phosphatase